MVVLTSLILLLPGDGGDAAGRCSIGTNLIRSTAETPVIIAVATGETTIVPLPPPPDGLHGLLALPDSVRQVVAHRFRVVEMTGAGPRLSAGETFLAVPWGYDAACDLTLWIDDGWVPAGAEAVFLGAAWREEARGERILDTLGYHGPYPYGWALRFEGTPPPPEDRAEWLSAREYFELVNTLPTRPASESRAARGAAIERHMATLDERVRTVFPGSEILRRVREAAGGGSVP
jgi:hypothetical protein